MKIGIITWFGGVNYGTNLQAIGLQQYLKKQGHTVKVINLNIKTNKKTKRKLCERIKSQPEKYINRYFLNKYKEEINKKTDLIEGLLFENIDITNEITTNASPKNKVNLVITSSEPLSFLFLNKSLVDPDIIAPGSPAL